MRWNNIIHHWNCISINTSGSSNTEANSITNANTAVTNKNNKPSKTRPGSNLTETQACSNSNNSANGHNKKTKDARVLLEELLNATEIVQLENETCVEEEEEEGTFLGEETEVNNEDFDDEEDDTDLITISVYDKSKRWSVGSTTNSEGDYSKVVMQFGNEIASELFQNESKNSNNVINWEICDNNEDFDKKTLEQAGAIMRVKEIKEQNVESTADISLTTTTMKRNSLSRATPAEPEPKSPTSPLKSNGIVHFSNEIQTKPQSYGRGHEFRLTTPYSYSSGTFQDYPYQNQYQHDRMNAITAPKVGGRNPLRITAETCEEDNSSSSRISTKQVDKWYLLFDKFDVEGFGEIPWIDFYNIALNSIEFKTEIEIGKLEVLRDLAYEKIQKLQQKMANNSIPGNCTAITFQHFVNIMSGKRSRSFKCAVHHRDREVSSENDFHLILNPVTRNKGNPEEISNGFVTLMVGKKLRFARYIAEEFLTDERDRKYYANHYNCLPPPVFIPILTFIQIALFIYYIIYHQYLNSTEPIVDKNWTAVASTFGAYYIPTPIASGFIYRPDRKQEIWRFICYMFVHAGWIHLIFNVLIQILICLPLEFIHGTLRIFCTYLIGILIASLTTSIFDPNINLVGGAGGVYCLLTAHLANILLNSQQLTKFCTWKILVILICASVDFGFSIYSRYLDGLVFTITLDEIQADELLLLKQDYAPISYIGHLTGVLVGLNIGLIVLRNFEQSLHQQLIWWVSITIFAVWTIFTIGVNVFRSITTAI